MNTAKITISLPKDEFKILEALQRKLNISRSALIDEAIKFWLGHRQQEELIKRYEAGYKAKPESLQEIKAMEEASAAAFEEEELK